MLFGGNLNEFLITIRGERVNLVAYYLRAVQPCVWTG